jgi:hypothetical protein
VIYGRAPGNTWYRAAVLVAGMAVGAFIAVNGPLLALYLAANANEDGEGFLIGALVALVIGGVLMFGGYTGFRYGEVYEFQKYGSAPKDVMDKSLDQLKQWMK